MTTPERLRRRQRWEAVALIVLGVAIAIQSWVQDNRDEENDRCMAQQFASLSESLNARSNLAQRESDAVAKLLSIAANAKTGGQVTRALQTYEIERKAIAKDRTDNPLPKFPTGRCTDADSHLLLPVQGIDSPGGFSSPDGSYLVDLGPGHVDRTPPAVSGAVGGVAGDRERQPDPSPGRPAGGSAGRSGSGGGGSGSGGGSGVPDRRGPVETLTGVVDQVGPVVNRSTKIVEDVAGQVTGAVGKDCA